MADLADDLLLEVLKACAETSPEPLYPSDFVAYSGLERSVLDEALDQLRLRGLVRLTDWVQGKNQGYAVTEQGVLVLNNPTLLRKARPPAPEEYSRPRDHAAFPWERGEAIRETLLNPTRPVVCMTLLGANLVMFALGIFLAWQRGVSIDDYLSFASGDPQIAMIRADLGAMHPSNVFVQGQWWRLLSHAFVHGGLLHVLMNMYFLYSIGPLVETMWGSVRFLILYLVGALGGACAVLLTMIPAQMMGASGALCGLLTSFGVWLYLNRDALPPQLVSTWSRNIITNIILIAIISTMPNVSWEAHLGGGVAGALVSLPLNWSRFGSGVKRMIGMVGIAAVPAAALGLVAHQGGFLSDRGKVLRDLREPYSAAEAKAANTFNEHAVPLLKNWSDEIDKGRAAAARTAFQAARQQLQESLERFDRAGPYQDEKVTETVGKARTYLEEWSTFYAIFIKATEVPPPWGVEDLQALTGQLEKMSKTARALEHSKLLPAMYHVKKEE